MEIPPANTIRMPDSEAKVLRIKLLGASMLPTLKAGDTLLVKKAKLEDLKIGDLVFFWIGSSPTVHRVISVCLEDNKREIVTKGDNVSYTDQPTPETGIIGKVIGKFENGRLDLDLRDRS